MCDLCSKNPIVVHDAQDTLRVYSKLFHDFSEALDGMARGTIKPHSTEVMDKIRPTTKSMVRYLATDWI